MPYKYNNDDLLLVDYIQILEYNHKNLLRYQSIYIYQYHNYLILYLHNLNYILKVLKIYLNNFLNLYQSLMHNPYMFYIIMFKINNPKLPLIFILKMYMLFLIHYYHPLKLDNILIQYIDINSNLIDHNISYWLIRNFCLSILIYHLNISIYNQ